MLEELQKLVDEEKEACNTWAGAIIAGDTALEAQMWAKMADLTAQIVLLSGPCPIKRKEYRGDKR